MTALATTTRLAVGTALASGGRTVHTTAPKVPIPPCLVIVPDTAWITPTRIGGTQRYELRLKVLAVARDNDEGVADLEDAVEDIMYKTRALAVVTQVTPPMSTDIGGQGSVLVSEVHLSIQVKE